jgi:hypothetical protein
MTRNPVTKVEYINPETKLVTFANGSTITMYWAKTLQQWVTIPASER